MLTQLSFGLFNGLVSGMAVFLVAAGVTLIFGILKILNFAQGSFFMIGAYVVYSLVGATAPSLPMFLLYCVGAAVCVAALGFAADRIVFQRLKDLDEASSLIATFALLLVCDGAVQLIWGSDYHTAPSPEFLSGSLTLGAVVVPVYAVFIVATGLLTFLLLDFFVHRIWLGKIVRAVAADKWMSSVLGVNVGLLYTGTVIFSFLLAGLAGGLLLPNQSLSPSLGMSYLLPAFIAVIIGGLGNVRGAFIAALALGLIESFNAILFPNRSGLAAYVAMIVVLLWRPHGLFVAGAAAAAPNPIHLALDDRLRLKRSHVWGLTGLLLVFVLTLPAWADQGVLFAAGFTLISILFALSWNLLFGYGGLATFGHAAFLTIGAYLVAYISKTYPDVSFLLLLLAAVLLSAAVAGVIGVVALRRATGIALAIVTLAFAEILRSLISNSRELGSDDGLTAIPRPSLGFGSWSIDLSSSDRYYWFIAGVTLLVAFVLQRISAGHFGRRLLCLRQDADRALFLGFNVERDRLLAFMLSAGIAGLAGGLIAPWAQVVSPGLTSVMQSTKPMLDTLLGGVGYFWGPAVGSVLFSMLQYGTRTLHGLSELVSGVVLLAVILLAPSGVVGLLARMLGRRAAPQGVVAPQGAVAGKKETQSAKSQLASTS